VLLYTAPTFTYLPPYSTYTHGHTGEEADNIPIYLKVLGWEGVILRDTLMYCILDYACLLYYSWARDRGSKWKIYFEMTDTFVVRSDCDRAFNAYR
jgi:hypothetical protein